MQNRALVPLCTICFTQRHQGTEKKPMVAADSVNEYHFILNDQSNQHGTKKIYPQ